MTNGIISFVQAGEVVLKVVAGCDGYHAPALARSLRNRGYFGRDYVYQYALDFGFGCEGCLVVQDADGETYRGTDEIPPLYREKFGDPRFNPRWEQGTAPYAEIIELDEDGQPIWPDDAEEQDD